METRSGNSAGPAGSGDVSCCAAGDSLVTMHGSRREDVDADPAAIVGYSPHIPPPFPLYTWKEPDQWCLSSPRVIDLRGSHDRPEKVTSGKGKAEPVCSEGARFVARGSREVS